MVEFLGVHECEDEFLLGVGYDERAPGGGPRRGGVEGSLELAGGSGDFGGEAGVEAELLDVGTEVPQFLVGCCEDHLLAMQGFKDHHAMQGVGVAYTVRHKSEELVDLVVPRFGRLGARLERECRIPHASLLFFLGRTARMFEGVPLLAFALLRAATGDGNVPSLAHALFTSLVSLAHLPRILDDDVSGASRWGYVCAMVTGQYMVYDLINVTHRSYYVHHGLAILACGYVVVTDRFSKLVLFVEANEVSTVFLATAYLGVWPRVSQCAFVVSFFLCRVVWLAWILRHKRIGDAFLTAAMCVHYVINVYWFGKILGKGARNLRKARRRNVIGE